MKALISILGILIIMMLSGFAFAAESQKGFVKIREGRELYVDYVAPKANQPTVILLNGLTYNTTHWDDFVVPLIAKGVGVLRYDMYGMGQTLIKYGPILEPISYKEQAQDIKLLAKAMKISGPFNLVGLSYGGGIAASFAAQFPKDVKNIVSMAPYTRPLDQQDAWIRAQIWATRQIFPYNKMSEDELYDFFLHQIIYLTYPQAEPIVLRHPYILEGVYHMVQTIRKFRAIDEAPLIPAKTMHLMIAVQDQYIQQDILNEYWDAIPLASRASRLYIYGSEHKIPEAVPKFAASWVYQIITGNPLLFKGEDFQGFPYKGEVRSNKGVIKIGKE